jgi:hypothetical protein
MVLCTSGYCILSYRLSIKVIELAVLVVQALYTLCCRLSATVDLLFRQFRSHPLL